jgi:hypothetical protein
LGYKYKQCGAIIIVLLWNKYKGAISKKITFSDTTPKFVVDESVDRVYVIVGNVIKAYDLK